MENMNLKPIKGLEAWARKQFKENHFIYYQRKGVHAECLCGECGARYTIRAVPAQDPYSAAALEEVEKPEREKETKCRKCGATAVYMPAGNTASRGSYSRICYGQTIDDEHFVFRIFYAHQRTRKGYLTDYGIHEDERIYLEKGKKPSRFDNYGPNALDPASWHKRGTGEFWGYIVHPETFKAIKKCKMLKYVPVESSITIRFFEQNWVIDYYIAAARYPDFEMIIKMGLSEYADCLVTGNPVNPNPRGKRIEDRLRINKDRIKNLIVHRGAKRYLKLYQIERQVGAHWTDGELKILEELRDSTYTTDWEKVSKVLKYTSPTRMKNYMVKQKMWMLDGPGEWQEKARRTDLRREYFDYISMRQAAGYDMTSDIILFPADFRRRRDEMILEAEKAKMDERKKRVLARYPKIAEKYKRLSDKYSAAAAGLIIRPAKDAAEIVEEGRILHHCVGGDNYLSSHNAGNSFILFLRSIEAKDIPLITVEIRGEHIIQWYGVHDSKPNEKMIDAWLETYTKELKKRKKKGLNDGNNNKQLSTVQASA